ncbi:MAG: MBL fold metallo-hydrolase [Gammaproteobacteria bacterium]|nr:MBL fold metallo-hydrolase [Gammaproteobacteria bacterium]
MARRVACSGVGDGVSPVEMEPVRVSAHVYYVMGAPGAATDNAGFVSNSVFVVTGDGVVVFDTLGTPALARMLLARIGEITDEPVRRVYISHYHADHVYGAQVFEDAGAEIVAPHGAVRYLESPAAAERLAERRGSLAPWVDDDTRIVEPHRLLSGEERFTLGGVAFRAVNVGSAHSDGDLILLVQTDPGAVVRRYHLRRPDSVSRLRQFPPVARDSRRVGRLRRRRGHTGTRPRGRGSRRVGHADPRLPRLHARGDGRGGRELDGVRRGLRSGRLERFHRVSRVLRGQPRQRLRRLPVARARIAGLTR